MPLDRLEAEARFRREVRYWGERMRIALRETNVEAERINQIAASLADLAERSTELRRYL